MRRNLAGRISAKTGLFLCLLLVVQHVLGQQQISIGERYTIPSAILGENRFINISLPDGYSPDSTIRYSVIYLLDGGVDEDFIHITGLVKYFTTPWINRFPASIVVGIENTNRRRDMTFATKDAGIVAAGFEESMFPQRGGSEKFMNFIEQELQPYINEHYKTNSSRTVIGESLAGLFATEVLLKKPSLFTDYIIVSPSLWWGKESLLSLADVFSKKYNSAPLKVYLGAPSKKEVPVMFNDAQRLAVSLKKNSLMKVFFDYLPAETHATVFHQAVYNAFNLVYAAIR